MTNQKQLLYLNGLDGTTGQSFIDPVSYDALTQRILAIYSPEQHSEEKKTYDMLRYSFRFYKEYKLDDPVQAGWGLLVHADEADHMKELLGDLIAHRNGQILLYQGEGVREWKEEYNADTINPKKFPYYVLIAGSPNKIPYELQFSLDVLQAVGRIDFNDPSDYTHYAKTVVNQEMGRNSHSGKRVVFFAPRHPGDYPTSQSSQRLVRPLLKKLPKSTDIPADLKFISLIGEEATKANLVTALEADKSGRTPALLFSASHGIGIKNTNPDQKTLQGSIVCQDFNFPLTIDRRNGFISGHDVAEGFCLPGGIFFLFACFGAGTRAQSDFIRYIPSMEGRERLSEIQGKEDFVSYLPKALLADPQGGALAVIGHVDPAWVHSFESPLSKRRRIDLFGFTLARLLRGKPVGFAVNTFNQKYTDLSTDLLSMIEDKEEDDLMPDPLDFTDLWICRNDAQNYVILGDPAVHLMFR
ncbi:MAG: hypothetical protein ACFE95_08325 [Candidatus Hodarchaeota archaeon]